MSEKIQISKINLNNGQLEGVPKNPRFIRDGKFELLKKSIEEDPEMIELRELIVVPLEDKYVCIAGNMRLRALRELGYKEAPCKVIDYDDKKLRAIATKDNMPYGDWDWDLIANEWDTDELEEWGFEFPEDVEEEEIHLEAGEDDYEEPDNMQVDVELGDLIEIGEHRLLCGDSTDSDQVAKLMNGEKADCCLTDPPYGLGEKKKSGKNDYSVFEDTLENVKTMAALWLPLAIQHSKFVVFSPGVTRQWIYPEPNWVMSWFYAGGPLRSSWGFNCWQPFLCYGKDPSLAQGKGARPDAIDMNTPANAKDIDHPCPKPIKLWEWFFNRLSFNKGDLFYEPFSGSGTTHIVAHQLKRKCYGMELDPKYCQIIINRMKKLDPIIEVKINGERYEPKEETE